MAAFVLIALGGMIGANTRYLLSLWAANRFGTDFPYGTFLINVSGSFVMGVLLTILADRFGNDPGTRLLLATGFLSAYTTFSTFTYETLALLRQGDLRPALANILGNVALSLVGAAGGILAAIAVSRYFG